MESTKIETCDRLMFSQLPGRRRLLRSARSKSAFGGKADIGLNRFMSAFDPERTSAATPGDGTAVHLSASGAVRHDVAHQVAHVVLQISDDVLDDVPNRDHAHDLARVQHG